MKGKKALSWLLHRWKWCLWVLLVVGSLVVFGLLIRGDRATVDTLTSQLAAQRWETPEKQYAQGSVFLPEDHAIPQDAVSGIRLSVENAMLAGGTGVEEYPWLFAFSRMEQATLKNGIASADVELTLVAGDYFTIHPMPVRNGWYLSETEVMRDRIILDRQTAWELFYSDNVVGQFLEWNGQRYMVAAVVDTEQGKYSQMAAGEGQRAWVFADSPGADAQKGFTCVEMVLPQPVSGFTVSTMQSVLESYLPQNTAALDNTGRFSLVNRWNALRNIATRWITSQAIAYPYYENAARLVENHLALRLIPEGIFLGFPVLSAVIWLWLLNKKRTWGLHSITGAIERAVERKRTRDYEAKLRGEVPERRKPAFKRKKSEGASRRKGRRSDRVDFSSLKYGTTKRRK